jgi:hypothetical protein
MWLRYASVCCVLVCWWVESDCLRVLDTIARFVERRAKESKAKQVINKSKNEQELTKLRVGLDDAYNRFMVWSSPEVINTSDLVVAVQVSSQILSQSAISALLTTTSILLTTASTLLTDADTSSSQPTRASQNPHTPCRHPRQAHAYFVRALRLSCIPVRLSPGHSTDDSRTNAHLGR